MTDINHINVLVTGAGGFIGKNLLTSLRRVPGVTLFEIGRQSQRASLDRGLASADVIFHLAGVNRPERTEEFQEVNVELTEYVCNALRRLERRPLFVLSSSRQAALDNDYGISKKRAEETVCGFAGHSGAQVRIFRLPGVFGKWCKPNYNSVVATFCHNIAHDLPITVSDPDREIEVVYVDDVVRSFIKLLDFNQPECEGPFCDIAPSYRVKLGLLADTIYEFHGSRDSLLVPDMSDRFIRCLYSSYLSYLPEDAFSYSLKQRTDSRGELAELFKSPRFGQIFVSRTRPGITRGNHYHDSKVEKFVVLEGDSLISFRHILSGEVLEYYVSGDQFRVVDIPPGYAHSIKNVGRRDLVVMFWANEIFEASAPDTYLPDQG